jgi:hypothetical protein
MAAKVCSRLLELIIVKHKEYMKVITDVQRQLINSAFNLALPEMQRALEEDFDNESKNEGNPGYDEYRMSFEAFEKLNAGYEAFREGGNELSDELLSTVIGGVGKCLGEIEWNVTNEYTLASKDDKTHDDYEDHNEALAVYGVFKDLYADLAGQVWEPINLFYADAPDVKA